MSRGLPSGGSPAVTYVIGTYPLLTTTFIDREIETLRDWDVDIDVVSLRQPRRPLSAGQDELARTTTYVRPIQLRKLVRRHFTFVARRPRRYFSTLIRLVCGRRQSVRQRLRTVGHFGLGVHVAGQIAESGSRPDRLHAHFIDRAAIVADVASRLLEVPYSVTAHAHDIYVSPVLLGAKVEAADFVATCTDYNEAHLREVTGAGDKIVRIHHGIDVKRYDRGRPPPSTGDVQTLLSVGQLKEKKGFVHLIDACRELVDRGLTFRCEIIGDGPQRGELERRIRNLDLEQTVRLRGARPHNEVIEGYRHAVAFVLAAVEAGDGDRDGIPNVILEAMAMQLPVISTNHSGIPEAVEHNSTGLLVAPGDVTALTDGLALLLADPALARRLGRQGRRIVSARFDLEKNVRFLLDRFSPEAAAT